MARCGAGQRGSAHEEGKCSRSIAAAATRSAGARTPPAKLRARRVHLVRGEGRDVSSQYGRGGKGGGGGGGGGGAHAPSEAARAARRHVADRTQRPRARAHAGRRAGRRGTGGRRRGGGGASATMAPTALTRVFPPRPLAPARARARRGRAQRGARGLRGGWASPRFCARREGRGSWEGRGGGASRLLDAEGEVALARRVAPHARPACRAGPSVTRARAQPARQCRLGAPVAPSPPRLPRAGGRAGWRGEEPARPYAARSRTAACSMTRCVRLVRGKGRGVSD